MAMADTITKIVALLLTFGIQANAVTVEVTGASGERLFIGETRFAANVGLVSVAAFDFAQVPYVGGEYGFSSIYDLGNRMVQIPPAELKAYGWCFSIDGFVPDTMADQTPVPDADSKVRWFYAYAHKLNGKWIGQCVED